MNKQQVEQYMKKAYSLMEQDQEQLKSYGTLHSQIATFGAATASGSLLSAIAFFSNPPKDKNPDQLGDGTDKAKEDARKVRVYLMDMIAQILQECDEEDRGSKREKKSRLFDYVLEMIGEGREAEAAEKVYSAAIAVKLTFNLFKEAK